MCVFFRFGEDVVTGLLYDVLKRDDCSLQQWAQSMVVVPMERFSTRNWIEDNGFGDGNLAKNTG